jgi:hypothetical protein
MHRLPFGSVTRLLFGQEVDRTVQRILKRAAHLAILRSPPRQWRVIVSHDALS